MGFSREKDQEGLELILDLGSDPPWPSVNEIATCGTSPGTLAKGSKAMARHRPKAAEDRNKSKKHVWKISGFGQNDKYAKNHLVDLEIYKTPSNMEVYNRLLPG